MFRLFCKNIKLEEFIEFLKFKVINQRLFFYYAGHGINQSGEIYFANYDIVTNQCKTTGLAVSLLSEILSKSKAAKIVLMADCCYSGGLLKECEKPGTSSKQALSLGSATASNLSTANWIFTQTLLDCLNGYQLADYKSDNVSWKKESKYCIHYKDYANSWDEWVGEKGLRKNNVNFFFVLKRMPNLCQAGLICI